MELDHYYLLLVQKSLSGEINPDESEALARWIGDSPDHARLYDEYRLAWSTITPPAFKGQVDLDRDFAQLMQRIRQEETPMRVTRVSRRRLLQIAAALTAVLAAVWLFRMNAGTARETIVSETVNRHISLPDGTEVWLDKGASIRFPAAFNHKTRNVQMDGMAYFKVAHDAQKPFTVNLQNGAQIIVLGTEFGVLTNGTNNPSVVLVHSGRVRLAAPGSESAYLTAGDRAEYRPDKQKMTVSRPGSMNELAWHTGGLTFVNTPLQQVVKDIQAFYKVDLTLANADMANCPYTAPLTTQPVEEVLRSIALVFDMRLKKSREGGFRLEGGNCR